MYIHRVRTCRRDWGCIQNSPWFMQYLAVTFSQPITRDLCELSIIRNHTPLASYGISANVNLSHTLEFVIDHENDNLFDMLLSEYRLTMYAVHQIAQTSDTRFIRKFFRYYRLSKEHLGSALVSACEAGRVETASLLIRRGADVNVDYSWPLGAASQRGHFDVICTLLKAGSHITKKAIKLTAYSGCIPAFLLLSTGITVPEKCLKIAAERGRSELVIILLFYGIPVDYNNGIALMSACIHDKANVALILLQAGARVSIARAMNRIILHDNCNTLIEMLRYNKEFAKLITPETMARATADPDYSEGVLAIQKALSEIQ